MDESTTKIKIIYSIQLILVLLHHYDTQRLFKRLDFNAANITQAIRTKPLVIKQKHDTVLIFNIVYFKLLYLK